MSVLGKDDIDPVEEAGKEKEPGRESEKSGFFKSLALKGPEQRDKRHPGQEFQIEFGEGEDEKKARDCG